MARLDSIGYYQFIYPKNGLYRSGYFTKDSIIQFAPSVVSDGAMCPVHLVYVDSKPVYFSWPTNTRPYSFRIDSGYHQIKLRTTYHEIVIDSMYFEKGKKRIFSLDKDSENNKIKINKAEARLSEHEKWLLYRYIVPYRNNFGEQYAYIEQDGNIQPLSPKSKYQQNNFAGPLVGHMTFHLIDSFSTRFDHEPFFEYEFLPSLLKMRSIDPKRYPDYLTNYNIDKNLADTVLTKDAIKKQWSGYLDSKRYLTARYRYPNSTDQGADRLLINFEKFAGASGDIPLNILIFKHDNHDFLRVYPGSTTLVHELQEGYYKLIFFYSGAKYHIEDSIFVQSNGLNHYEFVQPLSLKKDTFSLYVSNIIEGTLFKPAPYFEDEEKELKQIYNMYQHQFKYTGIGDIVEGYVYEGPQGTSTRRQCNNKRDTTYGTVTNLDGYCPIKVPPGNNSLNFSYLGYVSEDKPIGYTNIVNAALNEDAMNLEEVVVVGYGVQRKANLTGSITLVATNSLFYL
jgi:alpha-2-macroglobulin